MQTDRKRKTECNKHNGEKRKVLKQNMDNSPALLNTISLMAVASESFDFQMEGSDKQIELHKHLLSSLGAKSQSCLLKKFCSIWVEEVKPLTKRLCE